jgi:hypothetical protein
MYESKQRTKKAVKVDPDRSLLTSDVSASHSLQLARNPHRLLGVSSEASSSETVSRIVGEL